MPDDGAKHCGELAPGVMPTFAVFAQDGDHLLVVAGPQNAAGAYVFDTSDGSTRVLGPQGVQDSPAGSVPPVWDLSSAVWGVDGTTVLLLPRTAEATGPVLSFDLATGASSELIRLDAALANSSPSLWTTTSGLAIVPNSGATNVLWFADFATGTVGDIGDFPEPGGSLVLSSADPLGRTVLVCPKKADGRLGATVGIAVNGSQSGKLLQDSQSCAGSVFSADGTYLALTAREATGYVLIVVDLAAGRRVLTVPLPVSEPAAPPYLTWDGDMIVATDVTGDWSAPSLTIQLQH